MDLERVSAVIRPRTPWEAIDLGFGLGRAFWKELWFAWLAGAIPVCVVVCLLLRDHPGWALFAVWWLKPLLDIGPLYVVSRALFGATPRPADIVRALPGLWRRQFLFAISVMRFDPRRSFRMPVYVLEGLRGSARRARLKVLEKHREGPPSWLTFGCHVLEVVLVVAFLGALWFAVPEAFRPDLSNLAEKVDNGQGVAWLSWLLGGVWFAAVTIIEPFYVAAGFALYVDRRTHLEGWDIELAFRRLRRRLDAAPGRPSDRLRRIGVALLFVLGAFAACPAPAAAQSAPGSSAPDPKVVIKEVLEEEEFGKTRTVKQWVTKSQANAQQNSKTERPDAGLPGFLGLGLEALVWLAVALLIGVAIVYLLRLSGEGSGRGPEGEVLPEVVAGFDVRRSSLPKDVPGEALRLCRAGDLEGALSLLYRGAISRLLEQLPLELDRGSTEGDVQRECRRVGGPITFVDRLTAAWQQVAYAQEPPQPAEVEELCAGWARSLRAS